MPADLPEALLHSDNPESAFPRTTRYSRDGFCGHSKTKVFDLQGHLIRLFVQANDGIETP